MRAARRPELLPGAEPRVGDRDEMRGVTERRDSADDESGEGARLVGAGTTHRGDPCSGGECGEIGAIGPREEAEDAARRLLDRGEDQALHDLADFDTERRGGLGSGRGRLAHRVRANLNASCRSGGNDALNERAALPFVHLGALHGGRLVRRSALRSARRAIARRDDQCDTRHDHRATNEDLR